MIELITGGIGGVLTPLVMNLTDKIFGTKQKKIETEMAISANAVELAKIAAEKAKSDNEFEIERQKTIAQTSKTGIAWIDGLNSVVRVIIGLSAAFIIVSSVILHFKDMPALLDNAALKAVVAYVVGYYFSERSCQKVF